MSLIARVPSNVSSSTSVSPGKRIYGNQNPWSAKPERDEGTGQPVVIPQRGARPQQFFIGNYETELELTVESRSFVHRVNHQVRKRQKRSSMNVTEDGEKHFMVWRMFMSVTLESTIFT